MNARSRLVDKYTCSPSIFFPRFHPLLLYIQIYHQRVFIQLKTQKKKERKNRFPVLHHKTIPSLYQNIQHQLPKTLCNLETSFSIRPIFVKRNLKTGNHSATILLPSHMRQLLSDHHQQLLTNLLLIITQSINIVDPGQIARQDSPSAWGACI